MHEAVPLIEGYTPFVAKSHTVGLVFCACWNDHISIKWQKCGIFILLVSFFILMGLILPYITTMVRHFLPPFLPLVSDAGGIPPSNGIFQICLVLGGFFSIPAFIVLYESVNHRNVHKWRSLKRANKIALVLIVISFFGLIVTGCNPVGYTDLPNKFQWVFTVLGGHGLGATMILVGIVLYQFVIGGIWWYLPDASKADRYRHIGFIVFYTILFFLSVYPLNAMIIEVLGPNIFDFESWKKIPYVLPQEYTVSHLICAVCEYAVCFFSAVNITFFYKDLQKISLRLVLRHKSCTSESDEPSPSIKLKTIS